MPSQPIHFNPLVKFSIDASSAQKQPRKSASDMVMRRIFAEALFYYHESAIEKS